MKVLQVVPSLIKGGAERLALNISEELEKLGHKVLVVALRDDNRYPELNTKNVRIANASVYYSLLGSDQIKTAEYEKLLDEFQPDVIHSHLIDSELVSRHRPRKNTVYVTHWHGCPSLTNSVSFNKKLSKEFVWKWNTKRRLLSNYQSCNNHFLCISEFIQQYVIENVGASKNETTVIHNAIDLNRFKPMDLEKKSGFRLISIGSLQKNKNHSFLFNVVRRLIDNGLKDVYLDVYGEGPEQARLEQEIKQLKLQHHVGLHGIVSNPEEQLNKAHVLVHSAWHEPFGLIFIEAMACGIPVISFNTGGPAELITNNSNGFLIEKDNLNAFVSKITELYNNRQLALQLGKNGFDTAKNFGLTEYTKKIESLYKLRLAVTRE